MASVKTNDLTQVVKSVWPHILLFVVCSLLQAALVTVNPLLMRYLVDKALPTMQIAVVAKAFLLLLILIIVQTVVYYLSRVLSSRVVNSIDIGIKNRLIQRALAHDHRFYLTHDQSTLQNIIQRDTYVIATFLNRKIFPIASQLAVFISVLIVVLNLNVKLALIALCFIPLYYLIYTVAGKKLEGLVPDYYRLHDRLTSAMHRVLKSFEVIKAYGKEEYEAENYRQVSSSYFDNDMKMTRIDVGADSVSHLFSSILSIGIFGYAIIMIIQGQTTLGTAIAFYSYMGRLLDPVQTVANIASESKRFKKSLERVSSILTSDTSAKKGKAQVLQDFQSLEFKDVGFRYDTAQQRSVLKDLSFTIEKGKIYAFVGDSGAGKSTLAKLILGFFGAESGEILINGHPVEDVSLDSLRRLFGYIPQDSYLLPGTIYENLVYGADAIDDAQIDNILRALKLETFIDALPSGLETSINELGTNLSGGEKQRLAIARAILSDAQCIIADEMSGNLDFKTEASVMDAVFEAVEGKTAIIIAHRLSTITSADSIFVMQNGSIIEAGKHRELLDKEGVYTALWQKQSSEETASGTTPQ